MVGRRPRARSPLFAILAIAAAAPAQAASSPSIGAAPGPTEPDAGSRETARAQYARGLTLAAQNGYEAALREFTEAYAISPQFAVLYNIGQSHVALGHPLDAIAALSKYLRDGRDRLPAGRREQVQAQIASLVSALATPPSEPNGGAEGSGNGTSDPTESSRPALGAGARPPPGAATLAVRCADPGVKIAVDGTPFDGAGAARGLPVTAGKHRVLLTSAGRRPVEQTLEVAAGSASIVICPFSFSSSSGAEPRVSFDGPPVFSPAASTPHPQSVQVRASSVGVALTLVGIALEAGALGLYLWNRGQVDDANATRAALDLHPTALDHFNQVEAYNAQADSIHRTNVFTAGFVVAGGAALAGGLYLWRTGRTHDEGLGPAGPRETRLGFGISPQSVGLSWGGSW